MTGICVSIIHALSTLYVRSTSPCVHSVTALTAHLNQAPPLQYDSCVLLPGPAPNALGICSMYLFNITHFLASLFPCMSEPRLPVFSFAVSSCLSLPSLPPSYHYPPSIPPSLPPHRLTDLSDAHTRTQTHTEAHAVPCWIRASAFCRAHLSCVH